MEDELYAARAALRCLLHAHPTWTQQEVYSAFESGPTAAGESGPIPGGSLRSPHESLW